MAELGAHIERATLCGWECWAPGGDINLVRSRLAAGQTEMLSQRERDAYEHLMPATWWAAFQRGWEAAEASDALRRLAGSQ